MKRQATDYLQILYLIKHPEHIKNSYHSIIRQTTQLKKWAKTWIKHINKEDTWMVKSIWKDAQLSFDVKEIQVKATVRYLATIINK